MLFYIKLVLTFNCAIHQIRSQLNSMQNKIFSVECRVNHAKTYYECNDLSQTLSECRLLTTALIFRCNSEIGQLTTINTVEANSDRNTIKSMEQECYALKSRMTHLSYEVTIRESLI